MTTVAWVQDGNGNYEVSSPEHLKQIMHQGTLYTNAGSSPTDYWTGDNSFIQTVDIDLQGDSTDIIPIGDIVTQFLGEYDGGNFKIMNWSYVGTTDYVGLFGYSASSIVKNLRLSGVWSIDGFGDSAGFVCAISQDSSSTSIRGFWNIEADFDVGSSIDTTKTTFGGYAGSIFGFGRAPIIEGIVLRGSIDIIPSNCRYMGGIGGMLYTEISLKFICNLATFPSGIKGQYAAGISSFGGRNTPRSFILNAMIGDINASAYAGGISGLALVGATCSNVVNAMTGNIYNTGASGTGGIFGRLDFNVAITGILNYMNGDIISSHPSDGATGGIIGDYLDQTGASISSSICAMNGNVEDATIGFRRKSTIPVITTDTTFGLTFTTDDFGTSSAPSGLLTNSGFTDLPYIDFSGTDEAGNPYDFDFIFANLAGNASYSTHTHLILHKGDVSFPFPINFDVSETNTAVYLTFVNNTTKTFSSVLGVVGPMSVEVRSINAIATILEVVGATSYKITYQTSGGQETTALTGKTDLVCNIVGLSPETMYDIRLYADTGSGYTITDTVTVTTLENIGTNYISSDFEENGVFVLSSLSEESRGILSDSINDIFSTGDLLNVDTDSKLGVNASFVKLGENLSINNVVGVILPFAPGSVSGQASNLTLSDNSTVVPVTYSESQNTIEVNFVSYSPGDTFILDGRKVTVLDF